MIGENLRAWHRVPNLDLDREDIRASSDPN